MVDRHMSMAQVESGNNGIRLETRTHCVPVHIYTHGTITGERVNDSQSLWQSSFLRIPNSNTKSTIATTATLT